MLVRAGLGTSKFQEKSEAGLLIVLGFVLAALSPVWAALSLLEVTFSTFFSVFVPLVGLLVILFVGLPLLNVAKWVYGTYVFIYSLIMYGFSFVARPRIRKTSPPGAQRKVTVYKGKRLRNASTLHLREQLEAS